MGCEPDLEDSTALNLISPVLLYVDLGAHLIADLDVLPPDTMGQYAIRAWDNAQQMLLDQNICAASAYR